MTERSDVEYGEAARVMRYAAQFTPTLFDNMKKVSGKTLWFTGVDPYRISDLISLVPETTTAADLDAGVPDSYRDANTAFMIVGGDDYNEEQIERYVAEMGGDAAFLPQEGFVDLVFGFDWWWEEELHNLLDGVLKWHPGLQHAKSLEGQPGMSFRWPSTEATPVETEGTGGIDRDYGETSQLRRSGYSIMDRNRRRTRRERRSILSEILDEGRMELEEVAGMIAYLARQARKRQDRQQALDAWIEDHEWLKITYYDPIRTPFVFPTTGN